MRLEVSPRKVRLVIETTANKNSKGGDTEKTLYLPKENIHYWYPFNLNYYYKYSNAEKFMYLVKEKGVEGNLYNVNILKKTKPLKKINGVPFHPFVYKRNRMIIDKAIKLGIPTLKSNYTLKDVEQAFSVVGDEINNLREEVESRYIDEVGRPSGVLGDLSEDWDKAVFSVMNEEEEEELIELGEIYNMLQVMRKLAVNN